MISYVLSKPDTFEWCEITRCILCVDFHFLARTWRWDRELGWERFPHCYGSFFETAILKVTSSQLCSKFLLNNYEALLTTVFWKVKSFGTLVRICSNSFVKTWWNKNWRSCLENYQWHINLSAHSKEHCTKRDNISLIFIHFSFSQTNLVSKFNPVFQFFSLKMFLLRCFPWNILIC